MNFRFWLSGEHVVVIQQGFVAVLHPPARHGSYHLEFGSSAHFVGGVRQGLISVFTPFSSRHTRSPNRNIMRSKTWLTTSGFCRREKFTQSYTTQSWTRREVRASARNTRTTLLGPNRRLIRNTVTEFGQEYFRLLRNSVSTPVFIPVWSKLWRIRSAMGVSLAISACPQHHDPFGNISLDHYVRRRYVLDLRIAASSSGGIEFFKRFH